MTHDLKSKAGRDALREQYAQLWPHEGQVGRNNRRAARADMLAALDLIEEQAARIAELEASRRRITVSMPNTWYQHD